MSGPTEQDWQQQAVLAAGAGVKIGVKQEGWYRVSRQELAGAGFDVSGNAQKLQMYVNGRQIPIVVNGEGDGRLDAGDSVEFYGVGLEGASSDTRMYWLVNGALAGQRVKANKGVGGSAAGGSYGYTVERKDRTIYFSALRNGETENFFGPVVNGTGTDQVVTVNKVASGGTSQVTVKTQGVTTGAHQVKVQLNGSDVGVFSYEGQGSGVGSYQVAQSRLREGENHVRLVSMLGGGDVSLVDTVTVTYGRSYTASSNELKLSGSGGQEVTVGGFTNNGIRVFDVTDGLSPYEVTGTVTGSKSSYSIKFTVVGSGQRQLLALTGERARTAVGVKGNVGSSWRQGVGGPADLLVITKREYFGAMGGLVARRQSEGLVVALVDVEDLYDEFNWGNKSVEAERGFVEYWIGKWKHGASYLLLVGEASYDPKNYLGLGEVDQVPTKLVDTTYMEAATDDWISDVDGDGIADIATGRLPGRNATEVGVLVQRVLSYETTEQSNKVVLASDQQDGMDFGGASGQLKGLMPVGVEVSEIVRGTADDATVRSQLMVALNQGSKLVNYMGHGSVNLWRGNLLTSEDAMTHAFVVVPCASSV